MKEGEQKISLQVRKIKGIPTRVPEKEKLRLLQNVAIG